MKVLYRETIQINQHHNTVSTLTDSPAHIIQYKAEIVQQKVIVVFGCRYIAGRIEVEHF
jgi:hypothetical protein